MKPLTCLLAMLWLPVSAWAVDWPSTSLYHSPLRFEDQAGKTYEFSDSASDVTLVAFVYTHCPSVCPVIVAKLKQIDGQLPPEVAARSRYLLISLDPEQDTPEAMREFVARHGIADGRWHFLRSDAPSTREAALLLNIRYREDGDEIAHSNLISILDGNGVLQSQHAGTEDKQAIAEAVLAARAIPKVPR